LSARRFDRAIITGNPHFSIDNLHFGASIEGDINFDNVVDVQDLVAVILDWGLCVGPPPAICLTDVDASGTVDREDVQFVIDHWTVP
jgi:hypothetical protein